MAETFLYKRATFVTRLPKNYLFSPSHYWLCPEDSGWRVGFTRFATRMLGDLVDHQFEKVAGDAIQSGEILGSVEGFKAISDLYAPLSGTFIEGNPLLLDDPEKITKDPYGDGWLFRAAGIPDERCGSWETYRDLLDATIDKMLEKQSSE